MNLIEEVTNAPRQIHNIILDDGTSFTFEMYFVSLQLGWFIQNLEYQNFVVKGMRIANSPNLLNKFKNIIPFGLACVSVEDREPQFVEDFSSGNSRLFVLNLDDVEAYNRFLLNEIQ